MYITEILYGNFSNSAPAISPAASDFYSCALTFIRNRIKMHIPCFEIKENAMREHLSAEAAHQGTPEDSRSKTRLQLRQTKSMKEQSEKPAPFLSADINIIFRLFIP